MAFRVTTKNPKRLSNHKGPKAANHKERKEHKEPTTFPAVPLPQFLFQPSSLHEPEWCSTERVTHLFAIFAFFAVRFSLRLSSLFL